MFLRRSAVTPGRLSRSTSTCLAKRSFVGFHITEDTSNQPLWHTFTLSNRDTGEHVRLKVAWARLSEEFNTPDRTVRSLEHGGVAGKMRNANGEYFYWGLPNRELG
jgi:hypothetical protein